MLMLKISIVFFFFSGRGTSLTEELPRSVLVLEEHDCLQGPEKPNKHKTQKKHIFLMSLTGHLSRDEHHPSQGRTEQNGEFTVQLHRNGRVESSSSRSQAPPYATPFHFRDIEAKSGESSRCKACDLVRWWGNSCSMFRWEPKMQRKKM